MDTFYDDFTSALLACVGSRFHATPLSEWSVREAAAPERHKRLSEESEEAWEDSAASLDHQNSAFGVLESMLRIFFSAGDVEDTIDNEKEQVWLFGHHWLSAYYEFLMDTRAVQTTFYKLHHERFLELMRRCLCVSGTKRLTFREAALEWKPSLIPAEMPLTPAVSATVAVVASVDAPVDAPVASPPVAGPPLHSLPPKRLVLQGPRGHNRTRKSLRS